MIRQLINKAIAGLDIKLSAINLTQEDYNNFISEFTSVPLQDKTFGNCTALQYKGLFILCSVPKWLNKSYISSSNIVYNNEEHSLDLVKKGQAFDLRTLEEIKGK